MSVGPITKSHIQTNTGSTRASLKQIPAGLLMGKTRLLGKQGTRAPIN